MDQEFQAGTAGLQYAASRGLGVVIMEPLRGGNLALPEAPPAVAELWDQAEVRRTPVEWGLRWVWNHPEVTVVLSGMNNESHIEQNLALAETAHANSLTDAELDLVNRVRARYQELMPVGCTGCAYCMPCPMGVQIPRCFDLYNNMHMYGNEQAAKIRYVIYVAGIPTHDAPGFARQCVGCGECLDKCPQHISIPDVLKKVAEEMEGKDLDERLAIALGHMQGES
jgi:predicted aldo/keto reductase-like oxidoreductase